MVRRGIFIGRFQPFHKGHLEVMKGLVDELDELIILVGSSQYSHEPSNPFTAGERITMIRLALKEAGVDATRYMIIPVPDIGMHSVWVAQVVSYTPRFDVVYTNEHLTRRLFAEAGFKVDRVAFHQRRVFSATEIRRRMLSGGNWEELVPKSVARFIKEIKGDKRVIDLSKKDFPKK